MTNTDRKALILKKRKVRGIEGGSGVPNKKYDGEEVIELINIANSFPELREKSKKLFRFIHKIYFRGSLIAVIIRPPINPRFISTAL